MFYNIVKPEPWFRCTASSGTCLRIPNSPDLSGFPRSRYAKTGDVVVLENGELRVESGAVSSSYVYVDGLEVGEDEAVLRDRRHLADDGVVLITIGLDAKKGDIVFGPDVDSHGVTGDSKVLHDAVQARVLQGIETLERPIDPDALRSRMRNAARKAVQARYEAATGRVPIVIKV